MFKFDLSEFDAKIKAIADARRQMPFVCAYALTNATKDARAAEVAVMQRVFDRPTSYTLNSLQVKPATKNRLVAELGFKEGFAGTPAWKYLGPEVMGGSRRHKGFEKLLIAKGIMDAGEYAVPASGANLNGNGNMTGGRITQILSALGAQSDRYQNTTRRPKRANRRRNLDYFILRGTRAPNGIYLRQGRQAVPVILFVRAPNYSRRFPYYDEAKAVIPQAFRKHFRAGFDRYVVNPIRRAG